MEIERKFLVDAARWEQLEKPQPVRIVQGYLSDDENCTVRVRIKGEKGFITVKGKTQGISRSEYEYEIPFQDAVKMVEEFCGRKIDKLRFEILYKGHLWEVDVFRGKLAPLIIAEIELTSEDEAFELPEWVGQEVSHDPQYFNSKLVLR